MVGDEAPRRVGAGSGGGGAGRAAGRATPLERYSVAPWMARSRQPWSSSRGLGCGRARAEVFGAIVRRRERERTSRSPRLAQSLVQAHQQPPDACTVPPPDSTRPRRAPSSPSASSPPRLSLRSSLAPASPSMVAGTSPGPPLGRRHLPRPPRSRSPPLVVLLLAALAAPQLAQAASTSPALPTAILAPGVEPVGPELRRAGPGVGARLLARAPQAVVVDDSETTAATTRRATSASAAGATTRIVAGSTAAGRDDSAAATMATVLSSLSDDLASAASTSLAATGSTTSADADPAATTTPTSTATAGISTSTVVPDGYKLPQAFECVAFSRSVAHFLPARADSYSCAARLLAPTSLRRRVRPSLPPSSPTRPCESSARPLSRSRARPLRSAARSQ